MFASIYSLLGKRFKKWIMMGAALAIAFGGGAAYAVRPAMTGVEFRNIDFDKLISVHKDAFTRAGFHFVEWIAEDDNNVVLVFHFSLPEYPDKRPTVASYRFRSGLSNKNCAPCAVFGEVWGGGGYQTTKARNILFY